MQRFASSETRSPVWIATSSSAWSRRRQAAGGTLAVATAGELPEGVYRAYASYPLDAFALSEQARKDLAALEKLIDTKVTAVRFERDELEQARQLGTAHDEHRQPIIVGADVAGQLAGDYLARCVKVQRAHKRRDREQQTSQHTDHQDVGVDGAQASEEEARRAQRQADRQARERAVAFNLELGRAIYTGLSRVKGDERTLKLVSSVNVTGELGELAMRGARYGFPGWVQEVTQANGNTKARLHRPARRSPAASRRVPRRRRCFCR